MKLLILFIFASCAFAGGKTIKVPTKAFDKRIYSFCSTSYWLEKGKRITIKKFVGKICWYRCVEHEKGKININDNCERFKVDVFDLNNFYTYSRFKDAGFIIINNNIVFPDMKL